MFNTVLKTAVILITIAFVILALLKYGLLGGVWLFNRRNKKNKK